MKSITVSKNWDLREVFTITESILFKSFGKKRRLEFWSGNPVWEKIAPLMVSFSLCSIYLSKTFFNVKSWVFSKETKFTAHFTVVTEIPYMPFFENGVVEFQKYKIINISRISRFRKKSSLNNFCWKWPL